MTYHFSQRRQNISYVNVSSTLGMWSKQCFVVIFSPKKLYLLLKVELVVSKARLGLSSMVISGDIELALTFRLRPSFYSFETLLS